MAYDVTSWFKNELMSGSLQPIRKFYIGGVDYTSRVMRWPSIKNSWNNIRSKSITVDLANDDNALSFIHDSKVNLGLTCYIKFGLTHPSSGNEMVTLYSGTMDKVYYSRGSCKITLLDKFKQLGERVMGSKDEPVSLSNVLPSDIAWAAVTSYGGLSSVQSTTNPDINWSSFQDWAAVFSGDNVIMGTNIADKKVSEVLKVLSTQTRSAIYIEEDRLNFKRFSLADSAENTFNNDTIEEVTLGIDDEDIINRQFVYANYDTTSSDWAIKVFEQDSLSIEDYGLREQIEKNDSIWYVNSNSALNLAQRIITTAGEPYDRIEITSPVAVGLVQIGDTIQLIDEFFSGSVDGNYRIMEYSFDAENATVNVTVDRSQYGSPFTLDYSVLDGTDILV